MPRRRVSILAGLASALPQRKHASINLLEPSLLTLAVDLAVDGGVERGGGRLAVRLPKAAVQNRLCQIFPGVLDSSWVGENLSAVVLSVQERYRIRKET